MARLLDMSAVKLESTILQNETLANVIQGVAEVNPPNWYVGAGCIAQTVWNYQLGKPLMYGIGDIDVVYFDTEISEYSEDNWIMKIHRRLSNQTVAIDINNEARVHLWYKEYFGYDIKPYRSIEDAIDSWPVTATAIGVRMNNGKFEVYSSFGLLRTVLLSSGDA
jgi:hypothetical protein